MNDAKRIYRVKIHGVDRFYDPFRVYIDARREISERGTTLEKCLKDIRRISRDENDNVIPIDEIPYELQGELFDCTEHLAAGAYKAFGIQPIQDSGEGFSVTEAFQMMIEFLTWQTALQKKAEDSPSSSPGMGGLQAASDSIHSKSRESLSTMSAAPNLSDPIPGRFPI